MTHERLRRSPHRRWLALGVFVGVEWMILGFRFDTPALPSTWWGYLIHNASLIMPVGTAMVTASLLLGREQLRRELGRVAMTTMVPRRMGLLLVAHLVGFIVFYRMTAFVLEGGVAASSVPGAWAVGWLVTGILTALLLIAAVLPRGAGTALLRGIAGPLGATGAVGVAALLAGKLADQAWYPLGHWTLSVVYALLGFVADDRVAQSADMIVGTERFLVRIEPPCSGYQGMGLIAVFLGVYLWLFRHRFRFPRALVLVPVGGVVAWCLNAVRITVLIILGTWVSPTIAVGGFHSYSGALLFCGLALGLATLAGRSAWLAADPGGAPAAAPDAHAGTAAETGPLIHPVADHGGTADTADYNPAAPLLLPFLVLVASGMVTATFSAGGLDAWYVVRVLAVAATLLVYRRAYAGLGTRRSWVAPAAGALAFAVWLALVPAAADGAVAIREGLTALGPWWSSAWIVARVLGAVIAVPIAEELAFRGFLIRRLIGAEFDRVSPRRFTWVSFLGSSLLFGAMHQAMLAGTIAGAIYALTLYKRGALIDPIVAHATTNALLAAYVLTTGSWSLWT